MKIVRQSTVRSLAAYVKKLNINTDNSVNHFENFHFFLDSYRLVLRMIHLFFLDYTSYLVIKTEDKAILVSLFLF